MNHSSKRSPNGLGAILTPSGLPQLCDFTLATKVAELDLSKEDHERAVLLTCGLVPGKYGQVKRADRDWLMKTAAALGALPKIHKKKREQTLDSSAPDKYMDRECRGTAIAIAVIAKQVPSLGGTMPKPPARRNW